MQWVQGGRRPLVLDRVHDDGSHRSHVRKRPYRVVLDELEGVFVAHVILAAELLDHHVEVVDSLAVGRHADERIAEVWVLEDYRVLVTVIAEVLLYLFKCLHSISHILLYILSSFSNILGMESMSSILFLT